MVNGTIRRQDLIKALMCLGAEIHHRGGETLAVFRGTTIIVGRRHFSRAMLRRVERKLARAGIPSNHLQTALEGYALRKR